MQHQQLATAKFYLPDCLATWKWPRHINPHYAEVKEVSAAWLRGFKAFSPKKQYAYDVCDFSARKPLFQSSSSPLITTDKIPSDLLASLAYPLADRGTHGDKGFLSSILSHTRIERLRTGCDMMHVFFVFDEHSDVAPPGEVRKQADIIMDALRHPDKARPEFEWIGGEITRQ